jgi:malate dehydrogenase (quinone)
MGIINMNEKHYEVVIVGGGISGAALFYELAKYTNTKSVCMLEKYEDLATLNTKGTSNSQTIHVGDIETNYTLEKAKITKRTAKMIEKFCLQYNLQDKIMFKHQKMALGVGEKEVEFIKNRYEEFGQERPEPILAMGAKDEYTTVEYGQMTKELAKAAQACEDIRTDIFYNSEVDEIEQLGELYKITTKSGTVFTAANEEFLNGKVYMVQNDKLPFAALHGDPDILADGKTRFGPTALMLPKLERYKPGTYLDFFKTLNLDGNIIKIFWDLLKDSEIRNYVLRNFLFEVPGLNKKLFVKDARKIVPSLQEEDIEYAKGFGGIRPQVLNKEQQRLMLGEASINTGKGIIFNMTPSPGATSCLGNAKRDIHTITEYLNLEFDEKQFLADLTEDE